jgi:spore germination protein GerM
MAKKHVSLGCLFWLALILLILVIFLFNQKNIEQVVKNTGFLEFVSDFFNKKKEPVKISIKPLNEQKTTAPTGNKTESQRPHPTQKPQTTPQEIEISLPTAKATPSPSTLAPKPSLKLTGRPEKTTAASLPENVKIRKARLYFVGVNADGQLFLKGVTRSVPYTDSPLKEVVLSLLKGQTPAEINQGLLTSIPKNTILRNIYIKNNIAYLDFSVEFSINSLGREGLKAQLEQLIYTVTEFTNIKSVQFLIEGKVHQNLSSEGLYIGEPLSRSSSIE